MTRRRSRPRPEVTSGAVVKRLLPVAAIAGLVVAAFLVLSARCSDALPAGNFAADLPLVVLDAPDAESWVRLERASGVAARVGTLDQLLARSSGVVPGNAQLTSADHTMIHRWVEQGGRLVTPHRDLLAGLGIARAPARSLTTAPIPGSDVLVRWSHAIDIAGLTKGKGLSSLQPLITSESTVIVGEGNLGRGAVYAIAFDPLQAGWDGYEYLPSLGRDVAAWTHAPRGPERDGAEIYFDPGSVSDDLKRNPQAVAERLQGVRVVQVAGWNFGFRDPANDFDYAGLIAALHARGILVYAWLEPPMVNLLMWEDHPECREKTATGRDAVVDWRSLIALEDPKCMDLAWAQWEPFLKKFDFDGVNLAEMYFEPDIKQDNFTPFHPAALKTFGKDPAANLELFKDWREDLVATLNAQLLTRLNSLPRAKQMEFELTVIDDRLDPVHGRNVGSDVTRLAEVAKRGGASLQIEDPFTTWLDGPLRYDKLVPQISTLLGPGLVFLDTNVVPRDDPAPTYSQTGGELDLAVMSAARAGGRLGIFSVATIPVADVNRLASAMAGSAQTTDTGIRTDVAVRVYSPHGSRDTCLDVDDVPWPSGAGVALISKGEHQLRWFACPSRGPALLRLTGELGNASVEADALSVAYDSHGHAFAVIDRQPVSLQVDGLETPLTVMPNPGGGYTISLPTGTHTARIVTAPTPAQAGR